MKTIDEPYTMKTPITSEAQLCLSIVAGRPPEFLDNSQLKKLEWDKLLHLLYRSRLLPLSFDYFKRNQLLTMLPKKVRTTLENEFCMAQIRADLQFRWASEMLGKCEEHGVQAVAVKGLSTQYRLYDEPALRVGKDMDLMVPKAAIPLVRELFFSSNYMHGALMANGFFIPATKEQVVDVEAKHIELAYLVKTIQLEGLEKSQQAILDKQNASPGLFYKRNGAYFFYAVFDVHWNLFHWFDANEILENTRLHDFQGAQWHCLSDEWQLFYSMFKVYFESFDHFGGGMHHLVDMIKLIEQNCAQIQWPYIFELIKRYKLEACAFYVFGHLAHTFQLELPELLSNEMLSWRTMPRDGIPKDFLDFGDFLPFALGERIL